MIKLHDQNGDLLLINEKLIEVVSRDGNGSLIRLIRQPEVAGDGVSQWRVKDSVETIGAKLGAI